MRLLPWSVLALLLFLPAWLHRTGDAGTSLVEASRARTAPAFGAGDWLNGVPQSLAALRGQVVLLDFWSASCVYCRRSLPWLRAVHGRYARVGVVPVSVHSPLTDAERDSTVVAAAAAQLGIDTLTFNDSTHAYLRAVGAAGLPTFVLIDRAGRIRALYSGEVREGSGTAERIERGLDLLLGEPAPEGADSGSTRTGLQPRSSST